MTAEAAKNIMLRIRSVQRDETGKAEEISLETPGRYGVRNQTPFLTYEETELTGMKGTRTTLFLRPGSVSLVRTGAFMQKIEYCEGEESRSELVTPFGRADLTVKTETVENAVDSGSGRLRIVYHVDLGGVLRQLNEIVIDVWEDQ